MKFEDRDQVKEMSHNTERENKRKEICQINT